MAPLLRQYLSEAARQGFAWGKRDCMLFAADWVLLRTGADPAAAWRGRYHDETTARALLDAAGGPVPAMEAGLASCAYVRRAQPAPGDVVLARVPGHPDPIAGLCVTAGRTALLSARGLVVWPLAALGQWGPANG
jgi:hypothetical protein